MIDLRGRRIAAFLLRNLQLDLVADQVSSRLKTKRAIDRQCDLAVFGNHSDFRFILQVFVKLAHADNVAIYDSKRIAMPATSGKNEKCGGRAETGAEGKKEELFIQDGNLR